ncbi:ABC transporter ATP-binding protein [Saliphagus sp. LR7]|uniref:ABC transporter ATP-binding protein n=1 Tax=Saliphagus sp. LR7 TaxID=2282654 RepID=UPI000DF80F62|nr:ABC transporter ATP-binding protein [Saliphagus sp. LR7]
MTPTEPPADEFDGNDAADPKAAVVADGLTKRYGDTAVVEDLYLGIEAGTVYGLLGPNGAGKTTTIRMLTGLAPPTDGSARVAGVPVSDRETLVSQIGYLPESTPIRGQFTGREQLAHHGRLRGMESREIDGRTEALLERLALDSADDRVVTYSKGMRRKVGLIQAIMHEPSVVFLDEPTAGLDPRATRTVREVVTELADGGTTVCLSTHILPVVEAVADRVGICHEGELVAEGPSKELAERPGDTDRTLEDAFLRLTSERDGNR